MDLKAYLSHFIKSKVKSSQYRYYFREPLTGFASADDPLFHQLPEIIGEHHLLPKAFLPEAKTVMAFFLPFQPWVVEANRSAAGVAREWAEAYVNTNKLLNSISEALIEELTQKGIKAEMIHATHNYDAETLLAPWSHRSAAFIAGLGRFGMNRMLITPKGSAGRYGSIIFSKEVAYDARLQEETCITFQGGKCGYCVKACPTGALTAKGLDKHRCNEYLLTVSKSFSDLGTCDCCGKCLTGPCAILGK